MFLLNAINHFPKPYRLLYHKSMTNPAPQDLNITGKAIERIEAVRAEKNASAIRLRILVEGGGCSGYQYKLDWDESVAKDDLVFSNAVVIDTMSLDILKGSKVDFETSLMGEEFKIINPNAVSSCGCGTSFAV